jgi:hypothetical protein
MVRRTGVANADGGAESLAYSDDSPMWPGTPGPAAAPGTDYPAPGGGPPGRRGRPTTAKASRGGSGGRWMVWPLRIVLWAALLIIIYRGISAIVLNETPSSSNGATGAAGASSTTTGTTQFPVTLAEAYVMQFGQVYLNFSPADAAQRQDQLANFFPQGVLSQAQPPFGLNGSATMKLQSENIGGIDVQSGQQAVVTLLTMVNDRIMEFGVPVYAASGGIVISGLPSLLPAPLMVQPPQAQPGQQDQAAAGQLQQQLPQFFQAYANGNPNLLSRYLAQGASIGGLGSQVTFGGIATNGLYVPQGGGTTRDITVTVNWLLPQQQGGFATTYDMSVVDQGGKWYVAAIRTATQPNGTAP